MIRYVVGQYDNMENYNVDGIFGSLKSAKAFVRKLYKEREADRDEIMYGSAKISIYKQGEKVWGDTYHGYRIHETKEYDVHWNDDYRICEEIQYV